MTSGAECAHSRRNPEILPKVSHADAEYVSTVEQSTADPGTPLCRITGTFTTDEELLELVAAVHPELPKTAQFALCVTVGTAATTNLHHSVDELELSGAVPGASTRSWPSIYIPPWAGGEAPVKPTQPRVTRAPVGLLPTDPVARRRGQGQALPPTVPPAAAHREPYAAKAGCPERSWALSIACSGTTGRQESCRTMATGWSTICSTGTTREGTTAANVGEHGLHGVSLWNPFLWPPRLTQTGWPGTLHSVTIIIRQREKLGDRRDCSNMFMMNMKKTGPSKHFTVRK